MRILLASHHFVPSVGGIETVSKLLAREFLRAGHEVRVVTFTSGVSKEVYPVLRLSQQDGEGRYKLFHWVGWCDVFFQNQISLRTLWPWIVRNKPLVVATHTWLKYDLNSWLKRGFLQFARRVYASRALYHQVKLPGKVIYNPYEATIFRNPKQETRGRDLIFVGRLVPDKGVKILLSAVSNLVVKEGVRTNLTIVGKGPEEEDVLNFTHNLGLKECVIFAGELSGEALANELQRHRILVVPSLWNEPFGLVAVEAIACGCVVVGSSGGGLPEAIGPCGEVFPNGDISRLTAILLSLLTQPEKIRRYRVAAQQHIAQFSPEQSAAKYLELFASCVAG